MRFGVLVILALLSIFCQGWAVDQQQPQTADSGDTRKKPEEINSSVAPPKLQQSDIADIFAPHYDTTAFPMLAREEVRRSLEEPAYPEFYWALNGEIEPKSIRLIAPYDVVSYVHRTLGSEGMIGARESHRRTFANQKVTGLAFPGTPIRLLTARPVDFLGEWITDPRSGFDGDPYSESVFAVARCIVEVENERYREITITWKYDPKREQFFPAGGRIETIHDPLTMLMRLHDVETR